MVHPCVYFLLVRTKYTATECTTSRRTGKRLDAGKLNAELRKAPEHPDEALKQPFDFGHRDIAQPNNPTDPHEKARSGW